MPRILIVDDSPFMTRLLDYMLRGAGYETVIATSGPAALECIANDIPDLVFLDIMMPEMDGIEVLRRIRTEALTGDLPVVVLTAKAQDKSRQEAMCAGASEYLTKPYTSEQVLGAASRLCGEP